MMEGPGADSEEKHEPASGVDTESVDSLKALDPERPIREADMAQRLRQLQGFPLAVCLFRFGPCAAGAGGWRAGCSVSAPPHHLLNDGAEEMPLI